MLRCVNLLGLQDGSLPFARYIKDVHSEFRLLSKIAELLSSEGEHSEALQYATLAVEISTFTGKKTEDKLNMTQSQ